MSFSTITAREIATDMTLVIDGQHHIVEQSAQHDDDGPVYVQAETVIGDMGAKTFRFEPSDTVTIVDAV